MADKKGIYPVLAFVGDPVGSKWQTNVLFSFRNEANSNVSSHNNNNNSNQNKDAASCTLLLLEKEEFVSSQVLKGRKLFSAPRNRQ